MASKIKKKKVLRVTALSFTNALLMMWLTFVLLSYPYVFFDEFPLIRYSSAFKNLILKWETPPNPDRFAFINIAYDKALIDKNDNEGFPIGYQAITDREKLAQLFDILSKKPNYKYLVCDIEFKDSTEHDSAMIAAIKKLPRMAISYHRDDKDKPVFPNIPIPKNKLSLSDLEKTDNKAVKFKLFHNDSIKSTPLAMYEGIYKKEKFKKGPFFFLLGGQPILNSFIIDYRIRPYGFSSESQENGKTITKKDSAKQVNYSKIYLGELLALLETDDDGNVVSADGLYEFTKNRIVFIGDFALTNGNDIHETIYGDTQGPLILLNAFLALENKDNRVTMGFMLYLFLAYWLISYITFYYKTIYGKWVQKLTRKSDAGSFLASMTVFVTYFMIISIISFFSFNIHIGTLILAFYMNLIEKGKNFAYRKFLSKPTEEKVV